MSETNRPLVGILMGSQSDWGTMRNAPDTLERFGIRHESRVLSAHRTPAQAVEYAVTAQERGVEAIIAGAGGAAHLAGVIAAHTPLPVLGVPLQAWALDGMDSLLSTVQMPRGIPVATFAIGKAGAVNAAIFAVRMLASRYPDLATALEEFHEQQTRDALAVTLE